MYLILEKINGGELFDLVSDRGYLEEREAAYIVKQVLTGMAYLHNQGMLTSVGSQITRLIRGLRPQELSIET